MRGVFLPPPSQAAHRHGGVAEGCKYASGAPESPISSSGAAELSPKTKDPSGGTTGRGKPYGRAWGGWALAPNTASMGRDNRSHSYCVAAGSQHAQTEFGFF